MEGNNGLMVCSHATIIAEENLSLTYIIQLIRQLSIWAYFFLVWIFFSFDGILIAISYRVPSLSRCIIFFFKNKITTIFKVILRWWINPLPIEIENYMVTAVEMPPIVAIIHKQAVSLMAIRYYRVCKLACVCNGRL